MGIYICMCEWVCLWMFVCVYMHMSVCLWMCICVYSHAYVDVFAFLGCLEVFQKVSPDGGRGLGHRAEGNNCSFFLSLFLQGNSL